MGRHGGAAIVLTAPLTESIDHAGFFIQLSLASIPGWMESRRHAGTPRPRAEDGGAVT